MIARSLWSSVTLALALLLFGAGAAQAHEVRPGFLELRETAPHTFDVLWKVPMKGGRRLGLEARLPEGWTVVTGRVQHRLPDAFVDRWAVRAVAPVAGTITIDGLSKTRTDVLVRVAWASGATQTVRLTPTSPSFELKGEPSWGETAWAYGVLGVEHILFGFDHLVFVFALLLLVADSWKLLQAVTSFTVAHSITLALATFDVVWLDSGVVEALIALSIVFVGREILTLRAGGDSLTIRKPWLVAFAFGLLHGLGFAGALADVGLPQSDIPLALLLFNVGVELGQLAFVAVVLLCIAALPRLANRLPAWADGMPAYTVGTLGAFWFLARAWPLLG